MDPVSLAAVGAASGVAGGVISAIGNIFQGSAQKAQYKYQSGISIQNAKIAQQNADYERHIGEVQTQEVGLRTRAEIGQTKAIQSASGFNVDRGSAVDVRTSELELGNQNEAITRANSIRRAYGFDVETIKDIEQSSLYNKAAKTSMESGVIGATGSILGAASSVASKWSQASMYGIGS